MLTFDDCLALSGLTKEEVAALAAHERLPEIVAMEKGWSLCQTPEGKRLMRRMVLGETDGARGGEKRDGAHAPGGGLGRPFPSRG
jgi:hypothetical protein